MVVQSVFHVFGTEFRMILRLAQCMLFQSISHAKVVVSRFWYSSEVSAVGFDNYEETKRSFRLSCPQYFNFANDVIDEWARKEVFI